MVSTKYHTKKFKAPDRLVEKADTLEGWEGEEGGGEATSTRGKGPEGVTIQVMFEVVIT